MPSLYSHYRAFVRHASGGRWARLLEERGRKEALIRRVLSKGFLEGADGASLGKGLRDALSSLWAVQFWSDVEGRVEKIVEENGVERLRRAFLGLLYGDGSVGERLDSFLGSVRGLGIAAATEILCFHDPSKYPMWNRRVFEAIEKLGLRDRLASDLGLRGSGFPSMDGKRYERFVDFMKWLKGELESVAGRGMNFLDLDYFLYFVAESPEPGPELGGIRGHEEAQYYLLRLGKLLGYSTYVARQDRRRRAFGERLGDVADVGSLPEYLSSYRGLRRPEDLDVLWLDESGEELIYAFEVSHTTDVAKDAAALRDLRVARRWFIVLPDERKREFEKLRDSPTFRRLIAKGRLRAITYSQLLELHRRAQALVEMLGEVGIELCEL